MKYEKNESYEKSKNKRNMSKYSDYQRINSSFDAGTSEEENHIETPFKLLNISIDVKRGDFIGIIGKVGSGKSSLLNGILAEMKVINGDIFTSESSGMKF